MSNKSLHHPVTPVILALILVGCSGGPVVTIANHSTVTLSNIVVSGPGFTNQIESLATGSSYKLKVHPRGESGLRLVFDAAGQHVNSGEQGYFEGKGNYKVAVTVGTNLSVYVESNIDTY